MEQEYLPEGLTGLDERNGGRGKARDSNALRLWPYMLFFSPRSARGFSKVTIEAVGMRG